MKRLLAVIVVLVLGVCAAQAKNIEQGQVEISGLSGASFAALTIEPEGSSGIDIDLTEAMVAGDFYVLPNIAAGGILTYISADIEDEVTLSLIMLGPAAKFDVSLSDALNLYVMGAAGYAKATVEVGDADSEDVDGFFWQIGGGAQVFLNDHVALNAGLSYQMVKLDVEGMDLDVKGLTVNLGLSCFLF
jgi:opacity protein-like surface antigen